MISSIIEELIEELLSSAVKKSVSKSKNACAVFGIIYIVFFIGISAFLYIADSEMTISDAAVLAAFSLLGIPFILVSKFK